MLGLIGGAFPGTYTYVSVCRVELPWKMVRTSVLPAPGRTVRENPRGFVLKSNEQKCHGRAVIYLQGSNQNISEVKDVSDCEEMVVFEECSIFSLIVSLLPKPKYLLFSLGILMPQQLREKQSPLVCCLKSRLLHSLPLAAAQKSNTCKHQAQR